MKKVSIVALAILLFIATGCMESIKIYPLTPPTYLQGRYRGHGFELTVYITENNFIIESPNMDINLKEMISGGYYNVSDGVKIVDMGLGRRSYYVQLESQGVIVRYELEYTVLSSSGVLKISNMGITQKFDLGPRITDY